jgi:hypothetical protein
MMKSKDLWFNKHKIPPPYSRALPIHAKNRREWGPESARSLNGCRDDVIFTASEELPDLNEELPELNRGPAILERSSAYAFTLSTALLVRINTRSYTSNSTAVRRPTPVIDHHMN